MDTGNALLKEILDTTPVIAALFTPDREIAWTNRMCMDFTGRFSESIIGRKCYDIWHLSETCQGCPFNRVMETGTAMGLDLPVPLKQLWSIANGRWRLNFFPLKEGHGQISGVMAVAHEITPVKNLRQALMRSDSRLRRAEELAHIGHWELDFETNELFWSDEVYDIFEVDPRKFGSSYEAFLNASHPDDRQEIHDTYINSLKTRTKYQIEHRLLLPDGRVKYVQERCRNYYDDNGRQIRSIGTVQDITVRKKIEAENRALQEQFQQAQKLDSIGRLAGGVAHDFNNISSVILGYAEIALEAIEPDHPMYEYFTIINNAAQRAANITRQLLAFARRQISEPRLLDLKETMEDLLKMLERLVGENIEVIFLPGSDIWKVKIDPSLVDQIMVNLCINARDAIEDVGKITIEISNTGFDEAYCSKHMGFIPGEFVLLSVSDDGKGIPTEDIDKVFEPFYTTKEIGKGTGLGLSTVYGIVKQNRGFINVYSEEGVGTVIKIYLPRHSGEIIPSIDKKSVNVPMGKGELVMLVEDDQAIQKLITLFLNQLGYSVLPVSSPADAVEEAEKCSSTIDLLITDVIMPVMNGRILSDRLLSYYPDLKTLYISGYTVNVIASKGVLKDGIFFLSKPFSKKELAFKIRAILDNR